MHNLSIEDRPVTIVGCAVLQHAVAACDVQQGSATFLEVGLHRTPTLLPAAIPRQRDTLAEPSRCERSRWCR